METIIDKFNALPTWEKVLVILGLPFILVLLFFGARDSVESFFEGRARKATDADAAKIDNKIKADQSQIDQTAGKIEQLKADEKEAVQNAKDQDPTSFYNNRFGNKPDKQ